MVVQVNQGSMLGVLQQVERSTKGPLVSGRRRHDADGDVAERGQQNQFEKLLVHDGRTANLNAQSLLVQEERERGRMWNVENSLPLQADTDAVLNVIGVAPMLGTDPGARV